VQLSDGSIGRVFGINERKPLRPEVRILIDKLGTKLRGKRGPSIDLHDEWGLFIASAVSPDILLTKINV